ncbi:DUF523 domain-containing protein [Microbispora sp. RL4-1S]|uniref:DUF523 domain-containing protein n=1 Tax=Microbispora oryzae TaxID=2806554 RepID=A0A941AGL3_9ACTN|nr:DUF523 domain-containing protein [Microbispora oryzae]MBP2703121.1 DUF523 domain-containing protein [Microbispora oryzae]
MERILVSACLLGSRVRYDGGAKTSDDEVLTAWRAEGRLVSFCPEVEGGLPIPRPPAEIEGGAGGAAVLSGAARIRTPSGDDVTAAYLSGAQQALAVARSFGIRVAILKEGSPSCGSLRIHDGSFRGRTTPGQGVTTALLEANGIRVFAEDRIADAARHLADLTRSDV